MNILLASAWAALAGGAAWRGIARIVMLRGSRHRAGTATRSLPHRGALLAPLIVLIAVGTIVAGWLPIALAGAFGWWIVRPVVVARRIERRRLNNKAAALAHVVDLLTMCIGAGLTLPLALEAVATFCDAELAASLGQAANASRHGLPLGDALDRVVVDIGDEVRPLIAVLTDSERYGVSITEGIIRLGDDVRREVRRRAEERARRVPIRLLIPLVLCTLPAFVLLTLVPLVLGALAHLRFPVS